MKALRFFIMALLFFTPSPSAEEWEVFARVKFTSTFFKDLKELFLVTTFDNQD